MVASRGLHTLCLVCEQTTAQIKDKNYGKIPFSTLNRNQLVPDAIISTTVSY